eukprot:gb/GECG01004267.1/.p1 GENE.gb/GECG01004267.1/~~gb/GECG01004267.1/.p1  ORF type:complete len:259 (+),score=21.93 gb/GECG01004267.1/:1-777(+)
MRDRHRRVLRENFPDTFVTLFLSHVDFPGIGASDLLPTSLGGLVRVNFALEQNGVMSFVSITLTRPANDFGIWFELQSEQFSVSNNRSSTISVFPQPDYFVPEIPREKMAVELVITIFLLCFGCIMCSLYSFCKWKNWVVKVRNPVEKQAVQVYPTFELVVADNPKKWKDPTLENPNAPDRRLGLVTAASTNARRQHYHLVEASAATKAYQNKKGSLSHTETDAAFNRIENQLGTVEETQGNQVAVSHIKEEIIRSES